MSNKMDQQETKRKLKPRLRFPEFQDAPDWEEKKLGDVSFFVNEKMSLKQLKLTDYVSTENILPDYGGVTTASKLPPSGSVTQFKINDVLISNIRPYLKKVWLSNKDGGASNDVIVVRAKGKMNYRYLSFMLKNDVFIEYVMKGAKGVKMPRGDISLMKEYPLAFPSIQEQQKIADCLTSLDELIGAQSQKVEALRAHKKGLMQSLFPAEGEMLPILRFPEFRDAGDWKIKRLGVVCDMQAGQYMAASDISEKYEDGLYPCYGGNGLRGYTKTFTHSGQYPLIGRQGALCGNVNFATGQFHATEHAVVATPNNNVDIKWLFYELVNLNLNQYARGQAQPGLSVAVLEKLSIAIPTLTNEQQRIAECLSSLDEQITGESQKLEALKAHKKGLMQQLFPAIEEAQG